MWMTLMTLAAHAGPNEDWMARLDAAGLPPAMLLDCQPLGETLERARDWFESGPFGSAPNVPPAFWDAVGTREARSKWMLEEDGHLRLAMANRDTVSLEVGFSGTTSDIESLMAQAGGRPMPDPIWEDGQLVSINGEPAPPGMFVGVADDRFSLTMVRYPQYDESSVRRRMAELDEADNGCVVAADLGEMNSGPGAGHLFMMFPFDSSDPMRARVYLDKPPPIEASGKRRANLNPRSNAVPDAVMAISLSNEEVDALKSMLPPGLLDGPLSNFQGGTVGMFGDSIVVSMPASTLTGEDGASKKDVLRAVKSQMEERGKQLRKVSKNFYRNSDDTGFVGISSRTVVMGDSMELTEDVFEGRGDRWLSDEASGIGKDYPLVLRINSTLRNGPPVPPMTVGVTAGSDYWEVVAYFDDLQGVLNMLAQQAR